MEYSAVSGAATCVYTMVYVIRFKPISDPDGLLPRLPITVCAAAVLSLAPIAPLSIAIQQ